MNSVPKMFFASLAMFLVGCDPKTESPAHEAIPTKAPRRHFVFTGTPRLENLNLEDYAVLNRDMDGLLRRVGFTAGKGYLIPTRDLHGGTYPTLNVEGDSDPGVDLESTDAMRAVVERFALECEKTLGRAENEK